MSREFEFEIPKGLTRKGRQAAQRIVKFIKKRQGGKASTGGCRTFYTPQEWARRGEKYGTKSLLIVVYDGGDVMPYFNMNYGWRLVEDMNDELRKIGVYSEEATGWYASIYED